MKLADLIDLEAQLARDRDADPTAIAARDRALAAATTEHPADLLARWLDALRAAEPGRGWPGRPVASALAATRAALVLAGLALGWGTATAVLRPGGPHPVNVWDFLLAFVGVQLLLLALLLASFFLPLAAAGAPLAGLVRGAVSAALPRLARRTAGARGAEWRALWHRLRSRRSLYHHVEPWLVLATTQGFGVAFNVGALAAILRLVVFTDVAFAWSTTLVELDAARFHRLAAALATPWRALWPDAVPSLDLVAATRYSHLERAYVGPGASPATTAGGWWPFLVAALVCYGLLPRLVLLAASRARAARLLARLPLDDAEVSRVLRRLATPHVETRGGPDGGEPAPLPSAAPAGARAATAPGRRCALVLWRDAPRELADAVARQAGCEVAALVPAGGAEDGDPGPRLAGADPVVVLAESWEAPDRAALRMLRELRAALGPRREVVVVLADTASAPPRPPDEPSLRVWRDHLATLEDPWLAVEPLGAAP